MPKLHTYSLEQLENDIDEYIREHDAAMIYWHHQQDKFVFYGSSDTALFKEEMKILIKHIKKGNIVNVSKGLVVDVKGTQLYPVEFEFKAAPECALPSFALVADRPNWIIRRQAFEQNSFFTEDRQTKRNISTPSHPNAHQTDA